MSELASKCDPNSSYRDLEITEFTLPEAMEKERKNITTALNLPYDSSWQAIIGYWESELELEKGMIRDKNLQNSSLGDSTAQCESEITEITETSARDSGQMRTVLSNERAVELGCHRWSTMTADPIEMREIQGAIVRSVDRQLGINASLHE